MKQSTKNSGFTLVELIVVLVILAVLAAILVPALTGYIEKGQRTQAIVECRSCVVAAQTLATEQYASGTLDSWVSDTAKTEIAALAEAPGTVTALEYGDGAQLTLLTYQYSAGHTVSYHDNDYWFDEEAGAGGTGTGGDADNTGGTTTGWNGTIDTENKKITNNYTVSTGLISQAQTFYNGYIESNTDPKTALKVSNKNAYLLEIDGLDNEDLIQSILETNSEDLKSENIIKDINVWANTTRDGDRKVQTVNSISAIAYQCSGNSPIYIVFPNGDVYRVDEDNKKALFDNGNNNYTPTVDDILALGGEKITSDSD